MRYRCFCMTGDERILTGAFVEANSAVEARATAETMWNHVEGFHHVQVWLGRLLLLGRRPTYQPSNRRND